MEAAIGSQLLEGDLYPTMPLVIPTVFRLMAYSAASHNVYFRNRDEDEFNDPLGNPVCVKHVELQPKVQVARELFHARLITRFDSDLPVETKQLWFIAAILDPRFKKLTFDGDTMIKTEMRRNCVKWLTEEYNANFKNKVYDPSKVRQQVNTSPADNDDAGTATAGTATAAAHCKRRKVSSAAFFMPRTAGTAATALPPATPEECDLPHADELAEYLKLSQITPSTIGYELSGLKWWEQHASKFPNLEVMARQYLGCPATSASVERLFSIVGIAFSDKRQSSTADTLSDVCFTTRST